MLMKTTFLQVLLPAFALLGLTVRGQDVFVSGATGSVEYYAIAPVGPAPAPPAPAVYCHPRACDMPVRCSQITQICPPITPTVTYIGGGYGGCRSYAYQGTYCGNSTVIYFGRGQAISQGYLFGLRR